MMQHLFWIALGGAGGAMSRYLVGIGVHTMWKHPFPLATLLVNAAGSFLIGVIFVLVSQRYNLEPHWRSILMVGFLGAFTTFSTFSLESVELLEKGHYSLALAYIASSLVLCLSATAGGLALARHW